MENFDFWLSLREAEGDNVDQRTDAWYARRKYSVGGSQLGQLRGVGKYGKPWDVAVAIGGDAPRWWSAACAWGEMAEPISVQILELLGVETRMCGSLWGCARGHSNSVDGVGLLDPAQVEEFVDGRLCGDGQFAPPAAAAARAAAEAAVLPMPAIYVLEFKSYFSRSISPTLDREHTCQVLGGLDTIQAARAGMLMNTVTRRCKLSHWDYTPKFNRENLNNTWGKPIDYPAPPKDGRGTLPVALALVAFHVAPRMPELDDDAQSPMFGDPFEQYPPDKELTPQNRRAAAAWMLTQLRQRLRTDRVPDAGDVDARTARELLWQYTSRILEARYVTRLARDERPAVEVTNPTGAHFRRGRNAVTPNFRETRRITVDSMAEMLHEVGCDDDTVVAVMPLKVFYVQMFMIDRPLPSTLTAPTFTQEMQRDIDIAIEAGRRLREGEDPDEVREWHDAARADESVPVPVQGFQGVQNIQGVQDIQ